MKNKIKLKLKKGKINWLRLLFLKFKANFKLYQMIMNWFKKIWILQSNSLFKCHLSCFPHFNKFH